MITTPFTLLTHFINSAIPYAWDDSESWFEFLGKMLAKVNELVTASNAYFAFDYEAYAENLLIIWRENGKLAEVIAARGGEETLNARLDKMSLYALAMTNGSPKGRYATLAALQAAFPTGNTGAYLVEADSHLYFWAGDASVWSDGGPYGVAPLNTEGDLMTFTNVPARLPIGTRGYFLKSNGTSPVWVENIGVNVRDFGATGVSTQDATAFIQAAVDYAIANNIKTVFIPTGIYTIAGTINITGLSAADMSIVGDGAGIDGRGVSFVKLNAGYMFLVDLALIGVGGWRSFNISNICFQSDLSASGVNLRGMQLVHFYNCIFQKLDKAICANGGSHYPKIEKCRFQLGNIGIYNPGVGDTDYITGSSNGGIIDQCFFTYMTTPVTLSQDNGWGWTIRDTDFEGGNGTIVLSSNCILSNVDIERNLDNIIWLKILGDRNRIECCVRSDGDNSPSYILEILGDDNVIDLLFPAGRNIIGGGTIGKNNIIKLLDPYDRIADGMLYSGYVATNKIVLNETLIPENYALWSHDPTQWTIISGTADIVWQPTTEYFEIGKTSAGNLVLETPIIGTFAIGTKLYLQMDGVHVVGGNGFYAEIDVGNSNVVGISIDYSNNIRAGVITVAQETSAAVVRLVCTGNSGSWVDIRSVGVTKDELKPYFETGATANVERKPIATSIPTAGYSKVGDIVYNSAAVAGGFIGWVCTVAGTPGTWNTFGVISV